MESTFYFYYGMVEQWLIANGAKKKTETIAFEELPDGYW